MHDVERVTTSLSRLPPWLAWSWTAAARGLTYAIPAGVLLAVAADVRAGAAAAVSVIPGAVIPLAPQRLQRATVAVLGALTCHSPGARVRVAGRIH